MRVRSRLWILPVGLVVLLGAAESFVRAVRPPIYMHPGTRSESDPWRSALHRRSTVPGLDYELQPGASGTDRNVPIVTNSDGLRGPEVRHPRPPGSVRIDVLGDSVSFGLGVVEAETWPRDLERRLRAARPELDVEVLNHSVSGYGTVDESIVLEAKVASFEPDLVLVGYCLNDPELAPVQGLRAYFHEPEAWQYSALARLAASTIRERGIAAAGDAIRWLHDPDGASWRASRAAFERIRAWCAARGVPVLVIVFPLFSPHERWEDYRWRDVHEFVLEEARERGFGGLDLLPIYAASGRTPAQLRIDDSHPVAEGHALAAASIAERLLADPDRWLRPRR